MPPNTSESKSNAPDQSDAVASAHRIRIRRKRPSDAADDFGWQKDEELARLNALDPIREPFEAFVIAFEHERVFGRPGGESFALDDAQGRHIGSIMYYSADTERAEIGVTIGEPSGRGSGIGTEAMITFLRYLWHSRSFRRLELHALEWNIRAIRCFEKAGFRRTGYTRRRNEVLVRMEVSREYWLLWDAEGRFDSYLSPAPSRAQSPDRTLNE